MIYSAALLLLGAQIGRTHAQCASSPTGECVTECYAYTVDGSGDGSVFDSSMSECAGCLEYRTDADATDFT